MNHNTVEILAPAGSFDSLKAAVCAGADAVYMGGTRFGARAFAQNFTEDEMLRAIDYTHIHGRCVYMTVNTLFKDPELEELYEYLLPYYKEGLDGVIVQDLGASRLIRNAFPDLALHASTQMTVTGAEGADFLKEHGFVRIVPARELDLSEIRHMKKQTGLEIECFVHGALCYCYSGQCLLSSLIGGRSGNRGQCAQPCRLPYAVEGRKASDLLSMKDLCTIDILPQLIDAGIDSFKIEGRMKQPGYVYTVVDTYRRYTDRYLSGTGAYRVEDADRRRLMSAYRRRGYTEGYYRQHNGKNMISFGRMETEEEPPKEILYKTQEKVNGKLILSEKERVKLILECNGCRTIYEGEIPEPAKKQPLSEERIRTQMRKTGNTEFQFDNLEIDMYGDLFLPMQSLNHIRRQGLEQLAGELLKRYIRTEGVMPDVLKEGGGTGAENAGEKPSIAVSVQSFGQLMKAIEREEISRIYIESEMALEERTLQTIQNQAGGKEYFIAMPYVFRSSSVQKYEKIYAVIEECFDGVLARNLESLQWLKKHGYPKGIRTDCNVYVWNDYSKGLLKEAGTEGFTAPVELNIRELRELDLRKGSLIVYGYQPVMVTANCIQKTTDGCKGKSGSICLTDRRQKKFVVKNFCECCYNVIYNTAPLFLADKAEELRKLSVQELRLDFTVESPEESAAVIAAYCDGFIWGIPTARPKSEFTRGHYQRGVK